MNEQTTPIPAGHPAFATPAHLIQMAIQSGNLEIVREMLALQREHDALMRERDAYEARKAFEAAMAAAAAEMPTIVKDVSVDFTSSRTGQRTAYKHEDLGRMLELVRPVLAKHGLSVRWRTEVAENSRIKVTCRVVHAAGHYEENSLPGAPDESGQKNPMQAMGSGLSYLQRYTFRASIGLAASRDDDARSTGEPIIDRNATITPEQVEQIDALCGAIEDDRVRDKVLARCEVQLLQEIRAIDFKRVIDWLKAKKQGEVELAEKLAQAKAAAENNEGAAQ